MIKLEDFELNKVELQSIYGMSGTDTGTWCSDGTIGYDGDDSDWDWDY